jgi:predicted TIM-barrel fold metal-dependent hydrolase
VFYIVVAVSETMRVYLIIDSHVHVGGPPAQAEPANFAKLMQKSNMEKAIVFRYFYNEPTHSGNRYIQSVAKKYPAQYIGFAWINPNAEGAIKEIEIATIDWNLKGIKLHLEMHPSPIANLKEVFAEAERLSIPICIHLGDDFNQINVLAKEFKVNVIIAHLGTGVYRLNIERLQKAIALAKNGNVYLETSGNTYPFVDYAVKALGPHKIIFGSDFPHEHPLVLAKTVQLLELPHNGEELILRENIRKIVEV